MKNFEIDFSKLVGIITDRAPPIVGKNNGFVNRFWMLFKVKMFWQGIASFIRKICVQQYWILVKS